MSKSLLEKTDNRKTLVVVNVPVKRIKVKLNVMNSESTS